MCASYDCHYDLHNIGWNSMKVASIGFCVDQNETRPKDGHVKQMSKTCGCLAVGSRMKSGGIFCELVLTCPSLLQELRVFLEGDGILALCPEWQRLQPANGTLLDGVARLPKQLLGMP